MPGRPSAVIDVGGTASSRGSQEKGCGWGKATAGGDGFCGKHAIGRIIKILAMLNNTRR